LDSPELMVLPISFSVSPAERAASVSAVTTVASSSSPPATSWPRLNAALFRVSLRVPWGAVRTASASRLRAAAAYPAAWSPPPAGPGGAAGASNGSAGVAGESKGSAARCGTGSLCCLSALTASMKDVVTSGGLHLEGGGVDGAGPGVADPVRADARWRDDVPAPPPVVDPGQEPGRVPVAARPDVQVIAATRGDDLPDHFGEEAGVAQFQQGQWPGRGVDVDDVEAVPGRDADVGVGGGGPPGADLRQVGGGVLEAAASGEGLLVAGLEAEDGDAVGGVPFGRALQGAGAGEPGLTCSVVGVDLGEERVDLLPVAVGQDCVPAGEQLL